MNEKGQELPEGMEKNVMKEKKDTSGKQMQRHVLSQSGAKVDIRQDCILPAVLSLGYPGL